MYEKSFFKASKRETGDESGEIYIYGFSYEGYKKSILAA